MMTPRKSTSDTHARDVAEKAHSIRERMKRIGIKGAGYRIIRPSHGRIVRGSDDKEADSHTAHLARRC